MKLHFKLQGFDEVIIWRNEAPIEPFLSQNVLGAEMQTSFSSLHCKTNEIVIELRQPRGPRCLYGLLGAKIQQSNESRLSLSVGDGLLDSRLFNNSLIGQIEIPRYGVPEGAASHILKTLKDELNERKLIFNGTLDVCFGAHGDISSNIHVFKLLSRALPNFLLSESIDSNFVAEVFSR